MDRDKFVSKLTDQYKNSDEKAAEMIADKAQQFHDEKEGNNTSEDWISIMTKYNDTDAVAAWNYAVGWVDLSNYQGKSPYKIDV